MIFFSLSNESMPVVCPLTSKSLNLLTAFKSAFRLCDMDKPSNVIVQSQECHTKKDHVVCLFGKSELIKKQNCGEYVERRTKSSSCICKIMLYPSGKKECDRSYVSLYIQFNDLQQNTFIEGNAYILGKDGILVSKMISGCVNHLKEICFDTFLHKDCLHDCFVNNVLNIHVNVINLSQTYKCVSDKSDYKVHNSPNIFNFDRWMLNLEKHSDVILQMDSRMINCHKCILSAESQPFLILFRTCKSNILNMHDKSATLIEDLIRYIYCGSIQSLNFNHICQLYIYADEFGVLNLKDICSLFLSCSLSKINIPYIFELSVAYKDQFLIETCINFVKKNDLKILKETFIERSLKIKN